MLPRSETSSNIAVPTKSGKIFNVEEATGKEHSAFETTAAEAQINAPNRVEAMHVSENAEKTQDAANQAAVVAKTLGSDFTGEPTTAAGQFRADISRTTKAAVSEGKRDVQQAKAVGSEYVEQAKVLASNAIGTAQNYLPTALGGKPAETSGSPIQETPNLAVQVKDTAVNAYTTAVSTVQPQIDKLKATAQSVVGADQRAKGTGQSASAAAQPQGAAAQPYLETAKQSAECAVEASKPHTETAKAKIQETMGMPVGYGAVEGPELEGKKIGENVGNVPALTFPLETGSHTVVTPYPATKKPDARDVAAASTESAVSNRN